MRIAFLGLGMMGSAIARLLVGRGYSLTVWNRTASAAEPLTQLGATPAATAADAVTDAEAVFTMLHDDHALESVLFNRGVLEALPRGAVHVSMSTISVALAERLEREHAGRGQGFVAAPVFGRPNIAAEGKLWLAIAGEEKALASVLPVLESFSRGMTVVGDRPSTAHRLPGKTSPEIEALSEGITFAESHGLDAGTYLEMANSALFQSPFYAGYGKVMIHPPEQVAASVLIGQKDTGLFRAAAEATHTPTPLADTYQAQFDRAVDAGAGEQDWAAGYLNLVRSQAAEVKRA